MKNLLALPNQELTGNTLIYNITHSGDADGAACAVLMGQYLWDLRRCHQTNPALVVDPVAANPAVMPEALGRLLRLSKLLPTPVAGRIPFPRELFWKENINTLCDTIETDGYVESLKKLGLSYETDPSDGVREMFQEVVLVVSDVSCKKENDPIINEIAEVLRDKGITLHVCLIDHHKTNDRFHDEGKDPELHLDQDPVIFIEDEAIFEDYITGQTLRKRSAAYLLYLAMDAANLVIGTMENSRAMERFAFEISEADTYSFKTDPMEFTDKTHILLYPMQVWDTYALFFKTFGFNEFYDTIGSNVNRLRSHYFFETKLYSKIEEEATTFRFGIAFHASSRARERMKTLLSIRDAQYGKDKAAAVPFTMSGKFNHKGLLLFNTEVSYTGNRLLEETEGIDLVMMVDLPRLGASLRSNSDEVDVAEIAQYFEGGGHTRAAGFKLPPAYLLDLVVNHKMVI